MDVQKTLTGSLWYWRKLKNMKLLRGNFSLISDEVNFLDLIIFFGHLTQHLLMWRSHSVLAVKKTFTLWSPSFSSLLLLSSSYSSAASDSETEQLIVSTMSRRSLRLDDGLLDRGLPHSSTSFSVGGPSWRSSRWGSIHNLLCSSSFIYSSTFLSFSSCTSSSGSPLSSPLYFPFLTPSSSSSSRSMKSRRSQQLSVSCSESLLLSTPRKLAAPSLLNSSVASDASLLSSLLDASSVQESTMVDTFWGKTSFFPLQLAAISPKTRESDALLNFILLLHNSENTCVPLVKKCCKCSETNILKLEIVQVTVESRHFYHQDCLTLDQPTWGDETRRISNFCYITS